MKGLIRGGGYLLVDGWKNFLLVDDRGDRLKICLAA